MLTQEIIEEILGGMVGSSKVLPGLRREIVNSFLGLKSNSSQVFSGNYSQAVISTIDFLLDFCSKSINKRFFNVNDRIMDR